MVVPAGCTPGTLPGGKEQWNAVQARVKHSGGHGFEEYELPRGAHRRSHGDQARTGQNNHRLLHASVEGEVKGSSLRLSLARSMEKAKPKGKQRSSDSPQRGKVITPNLAELEKALQQRTLQLESITHALE